jgi:taurine dioxygenase
VLDIEPVPGACGAEIKGLDLSQPQSDDVIRAIREAFVEHHVVFFRDQHLDPGLQVAFGERFGVLEDYPFVAPLPDHPKVIPIVKEADETSNFGGGWHTDLIYRPVPPMGTMLYAVEVPQRGGDTLFADGIKAYAALSGAMQELLGQLQVEYNVRHVMRDMSERDNATPQGNRSMPSKSDAEALNTSPVHPLVRTHPESGLKGIYFSREHTIRFAGMTPGESKPLMDWLQSHLTQPVFTTRFHWTPGALAFWDNRCLNHCALNDYHGERRYMHRLTIAGDTPV